MLVLRVKRHRDDEPAENICVFDGKTNGEDASVKGPRILLKRMKTLDYDSALTSGVDSGTLKNLSQVGEHVSPSVNSAPKTMIPISKKRVFSDTNAVFVVDMAQVETHSSNLQSTSSNSMKILDPASRLLQRGIITALEKGNFDDLSAALIQGANADVQTPLTGKFGGTTALMAAAAHSNLRMIKRLLLKDVNPVLLNAEGRMASDLIKETKRNKDVNFEIRLLLQAAVSKHYVSQQKAGSRKASSNDQYVMDYYCVPSSSTVPTSAVVGGEETVPPTVFKSVEAAAAGTTEAVSVVRIEGLAVTSDGEVQIYDIEHDSDWSDLGDDEDPDSNDERYEGNDYPEEEDDDGDIDAYGDADEIDAVLTGQMKRMGIREASQYDTEIDVRGEGGYSDDEGYGEAYDD